MIRFPFPKKTLHLNEHEYKNIGDLSLVVSKDKKSRIKDLERFIAIAKKEHYNTRNYGKYFFV